MDVCARIRQKYIFNFNEKPFYIFYLLCTPLIVLVSECFVFYSIAAEFINKICCPVAMAGHSTDIYIGNHLLNF